MASIGQQIIDRAVALEKVRGSNLEREEYAAIIASIAGVSMEVAFQTVGSAIASYKRGKPWTAAIYDQWAQNGYMPPPGYGQDVAERPPVTAPPVAAPPVAGPPATEPPVAEPPVAEPPVAEPPTKKPPVHFQAQRIVDELDRAAFMLGRPLTAAEYAQVLRSVGYSPQGSVDLANQALAGNWGINEWNTWVQQNTKTLGDPARPPAPRRDPLMDPWRINPLVWDSLGETGQGLALSHAQDEGWDPKEYVRQIEMTRPRGSAPTSDRVRYDWAIQWPSGTQRK